jgi:hypothetical protein
VSPKDDFRRELNNAIDDVSGAPSPALRDRVRSAIAEAQPARSTYWIAAVAACVITALIVGILYINNPFRKPGFSGGPTPTPSASQSPVQTPSPSPTPTQAFICTADTLAPSMPAGSPIAYVSAMRTGSQAGYDRFVIEFNNGIPTDSVELRPQTGTSFMLGESGQTVKLRGKNGIEIVLHGADGHTSYSGKTDFVTGYATMVEVRVVEDFEGVIRIGVGINGPACYRAFYLGNPTRLVVDVQAAG